MNHGACRAATRLARQHVRPLARLHKYPLRRSSTAAKKEWSTPLAKTLTDAINTTGPISIAAYMRQCLTFPDTGYYTSTSPGEHEVFGKKGDFITSPEISQAFGELIGIWMLTEWMAQGKRSSGVELIEVGPGKGTLMDDMLRTIRNFKPFASSIEAVYLVEASPTLRDVQQKLLCGDGASMKEIDIGYQSTSKHLGVPIIWTEDIRLLPQGQEKAPFIVAHEFFDALPIHAFESVAPAPANANTPGSIMTPTGPTALHHQTPRSPQASTPQWRELVVSINPKAQVPGSEEPEFQLSLAESSNPNSLVIPEMSERYKALRSQSGSTIEVSPESHAYVQDFARRIGGSFPPNSASPKAGRERPVVKKSTPSGAALILDYGPASTIPINSLRGIRAHKAVSPLSAPGRVDISADVDFIALAEAAIDASPGVEVHGPAEQGDFLLALGIKERAEQLLRNVKDEERKRIMESGWKRLVEKGGGSMGKIYKALAIVPESGGRRRPVGFGGGVGL